MKDYYRNQNPLSQERVQQWTPKETVETIQNVSKKVRVYSSKLRETMKTLRESDAIPEMAEAIRDASFAVRDTVNDINETTKDLRKRGVIVDTASAIEATLRSSEDSIAVIKEIASDSVNATPHTTKVIQSGIDTVKKETSQVTGKVLKEIKAKAGVA